MKIALNGLFYQSLSNGSGQYVTQLLKALAQIDQDNDYVVLGPHPLTIQHAPYPYHVYPVPTPTAKSENIAKVTWEQFTAPSAARQEHADIYHVPYFAPPLLPRTPTVVTIQDIIPLRLPAYQPVGKVKAYMQLVARASHHATQVIAISQHVKQDIIDVLRIPAERIHVIYQAAGEEYRPVVDPQRLAQARARYGVGERYIFYLGGLDQRKNVPQLVRAFAHLYAKIGDPHLQLLIAGNPDKQKGDLFPDPRPVASSLGIEGQIIYRFIEEEDKAAMYSGASLFVFPSLYEGFGLDPLEAMACGAPVVCSNRTSLPEVVGDAALLVDPENITALVEAMRSVLLNDELRDNLRARSLQRAKVFTWRKTANETLAVYQKIRSQKKR